jgi:hypothetical protein
LIQWTTTVLTLVGSFPRFATIAFPGGATYKYDIILVDYPYQYTVRGSAT